MCFRSLVLILYVLFSTTAFGQKGFGIGPTPKWVEVPEFSTSIPASTDLGGYYYLLYNYQHNAEAKQSYFHYAIKVVNDKGLSFASAIDRSYDPTYERLDFHSLHIIRGSNKIDHLNRKEFEIIQREENLSRAMYDGSLTAIVNLKDVKAGDIVVYSYTLTGANPVFKGHLFKTFYLDFGVAVGKLSYRLITKPSHKLQFKNFGEVPEKLESMENGLKVYRWERLEASAVNSEDKIPGWHDPFNRVQITDFTTWDELSEWSLDLFKVSRTKSKALRAFIDSVRSITDEETRLISAIQMVQDKVRYFSFVDGMSSYQPHDPSEVFENRYGDCKDKSLLLSEILNDIGVKSHPVLVNTDIGRVMDETLPSPRNFNHCIVQLQFQDSTYYIDPTISFQRGRLKNIVTPDYYFGVVADKGQSGLTRIRDKKNTSLIRAREDFSFDEIGGPATLAVETFYSGEEADIMRSSFKSNSRSETDQNYVDFYANDFPNIRITKSVTFEDDTVTNSIKVFEEYEIPDFWQYDSAVSQYVADLYGRVLSSYIERPSTKVRKSPFYVRYPLDLELVTNIHLPEEWNVTERNGEIKGPGFAFTYRSTYTNDRRVRLKYTMLNTSPFVEASKTADYLKKLDNVYNELSFTLTYKPGEVATPGGSSKFSLGIFTIVVLLGSAFFLLCVQLNKYDPRSKQHFERHVSIEGWLILLAIGLIISPIRILILLADSYIMNPSAWTGIVNFDSNPTLGFWLLVELFFNSLLLVLTCFCVHLFFHRRTSAPLFITITIGLNLLLQGLVAMETLFFQTLEVDTQSLMTALISAAIWIPYLHLSERSKGTFVRRFDKKWFSE